MESVSPANPYEIAQNFQRKILKVIVTAEVVRIIL